jgi:hypothetical protein
MSFFMKLICSWFSWLLGAVALCGAIGAHAQAPGGQIGGMSCGFSCVQEAAFARQPGSKAAYQQFLAQAARLASQQRGTAGAAPDVTVPVVVHLVFSSVGGSPTGITDAQVVDALRILNLDFSKTNADTAAVIPAFVSRIANVGFQFRLAKLDPSGNCTTGITRTLSANGQAFSDELLKRESRWDPSRYLNIWVVDGIGTGLTGEDGYAYLPCTGGSLDGIVMLKTVFGTIGAASSNTNSHILTHEVGHYFGLNHTWGGTNTPGLASNCGLDDGITDTPNTIGTFACNLAFTSCTDPVTGQPILANVQNYMDYPSCICMFTTGQRAVMRASLALSCRSTLTSAANLVATGTNDGFQPPVGGCPLVSIGVDQRQVCANQSGGPRYFSGFGNSDALNAAGAQVVWAFPGGVPASSTQRIARVSYPTPGIYPVTLTITPVGGTAVTRTEPTWMQVGGPGTGLSGAVNESFENPAFPNNFGAADLRNWVSDTLRRAVAFRWQRASGGGLVAADGTACLKVPNVVANSSNYNYAYITSPALNLSGFNGQALQLVFRIARAGNPMATSSSDDELTVQYGTDCEVFSNVTGMNYTSGDLQVAGQASQNGFVPTSASQWKTMTLPLNPAYIGASTWVRFTFKTKGGNPFYLDQVRINTAAALGTGQAALAHLDIGVYPNPLTAETAVHFTLPAPGTAAVQLTDLLGRPVAQVPAKPYGAGPQAIPLPGAGRQALAAGVYVVRLTVGEQTFSTKVLVP